MPDQDIKQIVKEKYGQAALRVVAGADASCCGPSSCGTADTALDPVTSNLYSDTETAALPAAAVAASLGCGGCGRLVRRDSPESVADALLADAEVRGAPLALVTFPVPVPENFTAPEVKEHLGRQGYTRYHGEGERALGLEAGVHSAGAAFDPAAYARFVRAAAGFRAPDRRLERRR